MAVVDRSARPVCGDGTEIAYRDGDPVGWVPVAPGEHFAACCGLRPTPCETEDGVFVPSTRGPFLTAG